MKHLITLIVLVTSFLTVSAQGKSQCACKPQPSTKKYQGDARKKQFIGYSIDWTCDYRCKTDARDSDSQATSITGTYHEFHVFAEDGSEGVCEGMVYNSQFNSMTNSEVYMYSGENIDFSPSDSKALELKKWAETNNCD